MKKLLSFLALCLALAFSFCALTACGSKNCDHSFGEWVITIAATCSNEGVRSRKCSLCGFTESDVFPKTEHDYSKIVSNGNGTHTKTCSKNSAHTLTEDCGGGTATCAQKAICSSCGAQYGDLAEHAYAAAWSYDETYHWKAAVCEHGEKADYGEHSFDSSGFCSVCGIPERGTEGVVYSVSANGTYAEVVGYEGTSKTVRIASTYNGLLVKSIKANAFYDKYLITQVVIPTGVTSIGRCAFRGCDALTSVTIPGSVTSIADGAFFFCSGLESVTVADENKKYHAVGNCIIETASKKLVLGCKNSVIPADGSVTSIGDWAFHGCYGLTEISVPESVISIGEGAFIYCRGLESITVDSGNTKYHADGNCLIETAAKKLITGCKNSVIPADGSVTSIGYCAFGGCHGLTDIIIPAGVTAIGDEAFGDCRGLESITVADGNAKYHSENNCLIETATKTLILGCKNSVIPADGSVTSIGDGAFLDCRGLKGVVIPNGVTYIGEGAFGGCYGLTNITVPASVTSIGKGAFQYCNNLTEFNFDGSIDEWNAVTKGASWNYNLPAKKVTCKNGEVDL